MRKLFGNIFFFSIFRYLQEYVSWPNTILWKLRPISVNDKVNFHVNRFALTPNFSTNLLFDRNNREIHAITPYKHKKGTEREKKKIIYPLSSFINRTQGLLTDQTAFQLHDFRVALAQNSTKEESSPCNCFCMHERERGGSQDEV